MIQPIYLYGSEVLRKEAEEMPLSPKEAVAALVADLKDTLKASEGCGLAAPQIGVSRRVVIVDGGEVADQYPYLKDFRRTLINPKVLWESDNRVEFSEGCLSSPAFIAIFAVLPPSAWRTTMKNWKRWRRNLTASPAGWSSTN